MKKPLKVLIAEDDTTSRIILDRHLCKWGYKTLTACDGQEAWEMVEAENPDIAIIDWLMPGMDGLELCRRIRQQNNVKYTYIIFLTAKIQNENIVTALDAGADDYLAKPFDKNVLRSRMAVGARTVKYETRIKKSEERYQRITDCITDYIFTIKINDGKISRITHNDTSVSVTGYTPEEFDQDKSLWLDIIHEKDKEAANELLEKYIQGQDIEPQEFRIIRKDGKTRWVQNTIVHHFSKKGDLIACDCLLKDITERKASQKDLETLNLQLEMTYKKLMETAHQAGMAEMAADVLHNVGNALNSINISAATLTEKIELSEVSNIKQISQLLLKNRDNLEKYLAEDTRGKHILAYLKEVGEKLCDEQNQNIEKLHSLMKHVDGVKDFIKGQRLYSHNKKKEELTFIKDIIEEALEINRPSLERAKTEVIGDYEDLPKMLLDRHKLLQIIVNLIDNASHAMERNGEPEKILRITTKRESHDKLQIRVSDNGIGIKKENIQKVFDNGYTTKSQGHGFGLHSCKLTANSMNGRLTAVSDGFKNGATFILEIPLTTSEVKNAKP